MTRSLTDVFSQDQITAAFENAHATQERKRHANRQRDMRKRKPMTHTIKGLGAQIEAARAQARHVQDAALTERRREKELSAMQAEARADRRRNTRIGG